LEETLPGRGREAVEGSRSREVVSEERAIVPTVLLTGTRQTGQKQPVVVAYVGGEQHVELLVAWLDL
jgi:hypothetical protein